MSDRRDVTIYAPGAPTPVDKRPGPVVATSGTTQVPKGVVNSVTTGLKADVETWGLNKVTERIKAEQRFTDAATGLAKSRVEAGRAFSTLEDIDATLREDQSQRDAERERNNHRREMDKYVRDAEKEEWELQKQIRTANLKAKLADAEHRANAAQHGVENFVASTDSRIKQTNNVWEAKAFAAEAERNEHAKLVHGTQPTIQTNNHLDAHLQQLHDALGNAISDGDHDKAERLRRAIAALSEI